MKLSPLHPGLETAPKRAETLGEDARTKRAANGLDAFGAVLADLQQTLSVEAVTADAKGFDGVALTDPPQMPSVTHGKEIASPDLFSTISAGHPGQLRPPLESAHEPPVERHAARSPRAHLTDSREMNWGLGARISDRESAPSPAHVVARPSSGEPVLNGSVVPIPFPPGSASEPILLCRVSATKPFPVTKMTFAFADTRTDNDLARHAPVNFPSVAERSQDGRSLVLSPVAPSVTPSRDRGDLFVMASMKALANDNRLKLVPAETSVQSTAADLSLALGPPVENASNGPALTPTISVSDKPITSELLFGRLLREGTAPAAKNATIELIHPDYGPLSLTAEEGEGSEPVVAFTRIAEELRVRLIHDATATQRWFSDNPSSTNERSGDAMPDGRFEMSADANRSGDRSNSEANGRDRRPADPYPLGHRHETQAKSESVPGDRQPAGILV